MRVSTLVVLGLGAGVAALIWSFAPQTLPVDDEAVYPLLERAQVPPQMRVGVLHTGRMDSKAVFAYRGGGLEDRVFGMDVVVVEHPAGTLLFDAGFGRNVQAHAHTIPYLMRTLSSITPEVPVIEQLQRAHIAPEQLAGVVLTHAHWDHVSGLEDLRGVPVWVTQAELDFIRSGHPAARLARELGELDYRVYAFDGPPYAGFDASHDVFGDGTVVLVPAGGHTPGSVIAFVQAPQGRYALVGDLAWQREGIDRPAERPWLSRLLVDHDARAVRAALTHLHRLQQANPDLVILPAHDRRLMQTLPAAFTGAPAH